MGVLMVPPYEAEWPTLGPQLALWLQSWLVHGPGDVRGQPYTLDREKVGVLCRLYELHPEGSPKAGRRRFKRGGLSVRKGWAKTELGAAIAAAELHPEAPARFDHWAKAGELSEWTYLDRETGEWRHYEYAEGEPVGRGVFDPYVPMVAYTEEQSEELAYGALCVMLSEGPLAEDFDVGVERILVIGEDGKARGKAVALAAAPDSRDGARTTFQLFDETHRQASDRLRHAHETMLANVPKRKAADAWTLEVTTAYEPGRDSVAERTHNYARLVEEGKVDDRLLFYYHREASDRHDLSTREGMEAAVLEASGPAAAFTDVDYIVSLGLDPQVDPRYWERVWLNRVVASSAQVFPITRFDELALPEWKPERGAAITLGFDGSRTNDSTAIVGTDVATARQFVVALWEVPRTADGRPLEGYEIPADEVDEAIAGAFRRWDVVRMYADPFWWETLVATWIGRHGTVRLGSGRQRRRVPRVHEWLTNRPRPMALAVKAYAGAIRAGECLNDGHADFRTHLANARREDVNLLDEDGQPLYRMRKERRDSPNKIDAAMAGCLSWEAYRDAVALGAHARSSGSRTLHAY